MSTTESISIEAMQYCRDITRSRARNFYYGLKLLPEPKRSSLYAIYTWMRRADDIIDDAQTPAEARADLDLFKELTKDALDDRIFTSDPMWTAFTDVARQFKLAPEPFMEMIEGQYADLDGRSINTMDDLFAYCRQVASTVGLVCIRIWGFTGDAAESLAVDRGIAFQLTNILRDVREDLERGRCYLPATMLEDSRLTHDDLLAWRHNDQCTSIILGLAGIAREHYERSAPLDEMIDRACRPTLWAMTTIYRELLERIAANPSRIVSSNRVRLGALQKTTIALKAKWMARGSE